MRLLLLILMVMTITAPAHAQTKEVKDAIRQSIAAVDVQRIMRESKAAKGLKAQLEKKQESFKKEVSDQDKKLRGAESELLKQRSILSADAYGEKRKEFEKKIAGAQQSLQKERKDLEQSYVKSLEKIQTKMADITGTIAKERGYVIVLPSNMVILVESDLDITADVLKKLDEEMPSVSLE
jgi:outer membrane protein